MQSYGSNLLKDDESKQESTTESTTASEVRMNMEFEKSKQEQFEADIDLLQTRTKKLIVPFYGMVAIFAIIFAILGVTTVWDDFFSIIILLLVSGFGALLGAYGIYKWGTVQEEINRLAGENRKYEGEINLLQTNVGSLKANVSGLQTTVTDMKRETNELNDAMREFDDLRKDLESVAGSNDEILNIVNDLNGVYKEMATAIIANEKTVLYEIYYDVELRDKSGGLNESEWKRLMGRLSEDQRERLLRVGTFKELAGKDGIIDFMEFQGLIEKTLASYEEEIVRRESRKMTQ